MFNLIKLWKPGRFDRRLVVVHYSITLYLDFLTGRLGIDLRMRDLTLYIL